MARTNCKARKGFVVSVSPRPSGSGRVVFSDGSWGSRNKVVGEAPVLLPGPAASPAASPEPRVARVDRPAPRACCHSSEFDANVAVQVAPTSSGRHRSRRREEERGSVSEGP